LLQPLLVSFSKANTCAFFLIKTSGSLKENDELNCPFKLWREKDESDVSGCKTSSPTAQMNLVESLKMGISEFGLDIEHDSLFGDGENIVALDIIEEF
jgi:hypothetical protein